MELREWERLKTQVYDWDGGSRDIIVLDPAKKDWSKWIDLVNHNYSDVSFYNGSSRQHELGINTQEVFNFLNNKTELLSCATFKISHITANCRAFQSSQIEIDIDPREIRSIEDHQLLTKYMVECSELLKKRVLLSYEMDISLTYIVAMQEQVICCLE